MERIQDIWLKIKAFSDDLMGEWGPIIIVFLVALASFGLGRLSAFEATKPVVSTAQVAAGNQASPLSVGGLVVASRLGNAYHFPWCSGAQSIKEANKIWFKDEETAQRAGYTPAKNCKGLNSN